MPSGKQLSFINGEVSPSLRFRTDLASYAQGLSKLLNGYVRKAGGVSNRPGFRYLTTSFYQGSLPREGSRPGVRIFSFTPHVDNENYLIMLTDAGFASPNFVKILRLGVNTFLTPTGVPLTGNDAEDMTTARVSVYKNTIVIHYGKSKLTILEYVPGGSPSFKWVANLAPTPIVGVPGVFGNFISAGGLPDNIPVAYLLTQELYDGTETTYIAGEVDNGHPHATRSAGFGVTVDVDHPQVKQYNVYRASGKVTDTHLYLVGRLPSIPPSVKVFKDFIVNPDITIQPPLYRSLYGQAKTSFTSNRYISFARFINHYQQRRVVVHNGATSSLEEGTIAVSKLGTPGMMDAPLSLNDTDAFSFTIPINFQSTIVGVLEMERLVIFTGRNVIVIRGGEEGVLTPSTVNPYVASFEGCSSSITPVAVGRQGFFINHDHTKLMVIQFGVDNAVAVDDVSMLSSHLLEDQTIVDMVILRGVENIVVMLKSDGKLIYATVNAALDAVGWATSETDGFIESIASVLKVPDISTSDTTLASKSEALFISVIRSGVRHLELSTIRRDSNPDLFNYADSFKYFGHRLKYVTSGNDYFNPLLNIEGGVTWAAGETLTVKNIASIDPAHPATAFDALVLGVRVDFIFDAIDTITGKPLVRKFRFTPVTVVSPTELSGFFDGDIPVELQNAEAAAPTNKTYLQSKWLYAIQFVQAQDPTPLTHLANKKVSVYADGQVLSSPDNPNAPTLSVDALGELDLGGFYNSGFIGLPYSFEMETLDLDTSDNRTFTGSNKLVNLVGVALHETRGGFFGQTKSGDDLTKMEELRFREDELMEEPTKNVNGHVIIPIPATWEKTGRVLIKQVDPLPITVLAVYPKGLVGE